MIIKNIISSINWNKINNMIPVIIQNNFSGRVLMLGYMNQEALKITLKQKVVTFYSRVKKRLWTKGETSGNYLNVIDIILDCDLDSIVILVNPIGKTCHLKNKSCFNYKNTCFDFLYILEDIINKRKKSSKNSYTKKLYNSGIERIAQKVGEESVETILSSLGKKSNKFINEVSDLIYHLLVLINAKKLNMYKIICNLIKRNKND
ncbi:bifunctional phosphoribosyl-AMP cyclohydrolase/phosphoribosyl-ATP diphosphatase HisIE [Buchnera aphidicola (Ceratovacuna keduensis)]|uniref:bifunctional phosphoribosyl-AMP cyclohydrolase/phosphoribosyl-ATP diphosphatase HisIE n=1 Tax=Buchnera aphidicola TaxID=9 RepID=UPI0031B898C6